MHAELHTLGLPQFHNFRTFGLFALLERLERFKAKVNGFKQMCTFGTFCISTCPPRHCRYPKNKHYSSSSSFEPPKPRHQARSRDQWTYVSPTIWCKNIAMKAFWSDQAVNARFWTVLGRFSKCPQLRNHDLRTFADICVLLREICALFARWFWPNFFRYRWL